MRKYAKKQKIFSSVWTKRKKTKEKKQNDK